MQTRTNPDAPDLKTPVPRGPLPKIPGRDEAAAVEVTVDGRTVAVPADATLLDACRKAGVETPTLCYLENLTPVNVCRVCVVELEGSRTLVPSCSRKAEAGMSIRTDSERVRLSRRMVLEFLGSTADVSAAPELRRRMTQYGADPNRYGDGPEQPAPAAQPVKIDNDLYIRDYAKCILCYKCVEACGEDAQNTFAIAVAGRGFDAGISTEYDVPLTESACVYCGNCIGVCPTGALISKVEYDMREAGAWDESRQERTDTVCPYCGVGCVLTVHTQEKRIVKVSSPADEEVTRGHLCIKGRFGWQFVERIEGAPSPAEERAAPADDA